MIDVDKLKQDCTGKWIGIFESLGISVPLPPGNHGPCPTCRGGVDRFRLDKGSAVDGGWICNQCSPMAGDGVALVQRALGLSFPETLQRISEIVGTVEFAPQNGNGSKRDPRKDLNELWQKSLKLTGSDPVSIYLQSRKISLQPADVRYCPNCYESETKKELPAMVALVRGFDGKPVTIHRTYLDGRQKADIAAPKKLMPGICKLSGVAVRLMPHKELLGIAEGIETAMSAAQIFYGVPVWAAINSTLLETWEPPEGVRKVVIFADNDPNYTGQKSAYRLANKLFSKDLIVNVEVPAKKDFNDEL